MALMPPTPRRSARLSDPDNGLSGRYAIRSPNNPFQSSPATANHAGPSTSSSSVRPRGSKAAPKRRERRFEDIDSEEEEGDVNGGESMFRPVTKGNVPRQPRATFYEEAGDDGFIFSAAAPTTQSAVAAQASQPSGKGKGKAAMVQDARGAPPKRPPTGTPTQMGQPRYPSGSSVKAHRRVSLLDDGTVALPHPQIPDADLFRHVSSDLEPRQRLQHLTYWCLQRGATKILDKCPSSSRQTLDVAVQRTLGDLKQGTLQLDWPGRLRPSSTARKPHPRNEANRRIEQQLTQTIKAMQKEKAQWDQAEEELNTMEAEMRAAEASEDQEQAGHGSTSTLRQELDQEQDDWEIHDSVRSALTQAAMWLAPGGHQQQQDERGEITGLALDLVRLSSQLFSAQNDQQPPPPRPKRRRTSSYRPDGTAADATGSQDVVPTVAPSAIIQGTDLDPRWDHVEWNVDLLHSQTHTLTQLADLSDRYLAAVSARGAQAICDLIAATPSASDGVAARAAGIADQEGLEGGLVASRISQENQRHLQRILSGIRRLQSTEVGGGEDEPAAATGDVSDGDLLRAFAGFSDRSSRQRRRTTRHEK